ncbi:hypothetical protein F4803DRAFT_283932 [Xylaria telfairii]|nr:hypothetical protein F4803DRAFT_283932 [Xylaria telfairii]
MLASANRTFLNSLLDQNSLIDGPDAGFVFDEAPNQIKGGVHPERLADISIMRLQAIDCISSTRDGVPGESVRRGSPAIATRAGGIPICIDNLSCLAVEEAVVSNTGMV